MCSSGSLEGGFPISLDGQVLVPSEMVIESSGALIVAPSDLGLMSAAGSLTVVSAIESPGALVVASSDLGLASSSGSLTVVTVVKSSGASVVASSGLALMSAAGSLTVASVAEFPWSYLHRW